MTIKVFVPLSDEMLYEHPELITGPIGAFSPQRVDFPVSGHVREKGVHWRKNNDQGGDIRRKTVGGGQMLNERAFADKTLTKTDPRR